LTYAAAPAMVMTDPGNWLLPTLTQNMGFGLVYIFNHEFEH
jgi:hypothetical protein